MMNLKQKVILWVIRGLDRDTWRRRVVVKVLAGKLNQWMEAHKMKSWKTTVFGLVSAIGAYLVTVNDPAWVSSLGKVLALVGPIGLGLVARDNDKSSEDVGTK